jgi:predicted Zn-dependent protease
MIPRFFYILIACICVFCVTTQQASAQVIIRDTEIERTLKEWSAPIFKAAGLSPDNVKIIIVRDSSINAFVAGGANIFLFTGLLSKAENPGEIIGVIAHETGHISGGHLIRMHSAMEQASYETIIGTVLGIGAAIISGEGSAANAIISGSQNMAVRRYLANSRLHESSADQAAISFINKAGYSPIGLLTFMEKLEGEELLPASQQDEYVRTHPLTTNRMAALRTGVDQSPNTLPYPPEWRGQYERMLAKLDGFLDPQKVTYQYPSSDTSIPARYAQAVAAYQQNRVEEAISLIDGLINSEPQNPYFHELKGQMLLEFGRVSEALPPYKRAAELAPDAALIQIAYAHALIESAGQNGTSKLNQAIQHLHRAEREEARSTQLHRLLATAYGRLGNDAEARLHLAEEAFLQERYPDARRFAEFAKTSAQPGSRTAIRANDILQMISQADAAAR